jgi:hypothetical protein
MKLSRMLPFLFITIFLLVCLSVDAQCAMCKTSAEQSGYAAKLNTGIFYLLFAPVVVLGGVLLFWIKNKDKFK